MLRLTGSVALMLTETDPDKWKKHLRKEDGRCVIYVVCNKAIYGTMNAALLAYNKFGKASQLMGIYHESLRAMSME